MSGSVAQEHLLEMLEELGAIQGVRGALIATADGALASGARSGLPGATAQDVAKTVRRMTVASATVGVPLEELLINFGAARMVVIPLNDEATVVVLLERDQAVAPVRSLLQVQLESMRRLLDANNEPAYQRTLDGDEEIDRLLQSELGPVLQKIGRQFATFLMRMGRTNAEAKDLMREQMREWLLCCNPSPFTFPLLIDGLGQLLNDAPDERSEFLEVVQSTIRDAQTTAES